MARKPTVKLRKEMISSVGPRVVRSHREKHAERAPGLWRGR